MYDKLTKSDIRKMEEEIEMRKLQLRPELIARVKEARSHGDLSENFEYYAARREKGSNDSRIAYLERMIKTAQIIDDESGDDEVGMNDLVTIHYEDDDEDEKFKIVTTVRQDTLNGKISIDSPIGKAVLGHKKGERVLVTVNKDVSYYVVIKAIEKNSDDSDDELNKF